MSGFNYLINLTVVGGGALDRAIAATDRFENSLERVQSETDATGRAVKKLGNDGRNAFDSMRSSVGSFVAGLGIAVATMGSLQTAAQNEGLEKSIEFAGGAAGAKNLEFVRTEVERLGLPLKESLEGFKTLSGSMMDTGISAEQQHNIFQGLGEGIATFRLPAEQANRAMLALGQMASKGTVSAEELKGQLGEALPGAFTVAARAMGVTQTKLNDMLKDGDVLAKDFLPKFAAEMHNTFGKSAIDATDSATANFNRMNASMYDLRVTIGEQLMPTVLGLMQNYLIPAVSWIGRNIEMLGGLVTVFGSLYLAAKTYTIYTGIMSLVTGEFTGSVWGLNAALLSNPIAWVIGGFVALSSAVVYAWNKSEGFRGFLFGMWESIKTFGSLLVDRFVKPVIAAFEILRGAWNGSTEQVQQGMQTLKESATSWGKDFGTEMSNSFTKGWNNGVADFNNAAVAPVVSQAPGAPGAAFGGANFNSPAGSNKGNKTASDASKMANGITGGGSKNVVINFNGKMVESFTVQTTNVREGVESLRDLLIKELAQVLNSANQVQTN